MPKAVTGVHVVAHLGSFLPKTSETPLYLWQSSLKQKLL